MSVRREKSFDRLAKAMREASSKRGGTAGNNDARLRALTEAYLQVGNEPERRELLRRYRAGDPLKGEDGIRRALAAMDLAYFGRAYLPHYFSRPSPQFHAELDTLWRDGVLKGIVPIGDNAKLVDAQDGCRRATPHRAATQNRRTSHLRDHCTQPCTAISGISSSFRTQVTKRTDF